MEKLLKQCSLCDIDIEKMKTKKKNTISAELRCMARTWGGGLGIQCSYKKKDGEDFCGQHLKNGWIKHGRIDEDPPELFKNSGSKNKKKKHKSGPKKNMSAFMFFRKEKTKEYQIKNPDIKKQCDIAKLMGYDWNKLSDEDKLPFKKMEEDDKKRYEEELKVFNSSDNHVTASSDSANEDKTTKADKNVIESTGPGIESSTIEEEKEVAVVPYKYKGNEYLLDIDTGKVYDTTYDFVGKKVGNTIDFEAVDSSDDES
jgi:hypothetical protein